MPKFDLKVAKDIPVDIPIFVLEKDGKTSYLLGTNHALPLEVLPAYYHSIIKSAKAFVTEMTEEPLTEKVLLDLGIITPAASEGGCFSWFRQCLGMKATEGDWFNRLSERAQVILEKKFKLFLSQRNAPSIPVARLAPGIGHLICMFAYDRGMDFELESFFSPKVHALDTRKDVIGGLKVQFSKKISLEELENVLVNDYDDNAASQKDTDLWFHFNYLSGSLLYDPVIQQLSKDKNTVIDRNEKWLPKILKYHKELESLIGVGLAHLPGEEGLLNLLSRKRFKISVLNAKGELKPYSTHLVKSEIADCYPLPGYCVKLIGEYAEDIAAEADSAKGVTYSFDSKRCGKTDSGSVVVEPSATSTIAPTH